LHAAHQGCFISVLNNMEDYVRFQVLMAATMKTAVIRGLTLSSLVVVTIVSHPVASETSNLQLCNTS